MLALIGSFLIFIPLSIVGIVLIGCMKISTIMKYLNLIWYGPYFIVSFAWGMACIFVTHHIDHWRYVRTHRSEVELIKAAKKAGAKTYQCSGCRDGWCDGCSPL